MTPKETGPWLAGIKTGMIHYVGDPSTVDKPSWTPYAALAKRWTDREDAIKAAKRAGQTFNLKDGRPCLQLESQAFSRNYMDCEVLPP